MGVLKNTKMLGVGHRVAGGCHASRNEGRLPLHHSPHRTPPRPLTTRLPPPPPLPTYSPHRPAPSLPPTNQHTHTLTQAFSRMSLQAPYPPFPLSPATRECARRMPAPSTQPPPPCPLHTSPPSTFPHRPSELRSHARSLRVELVHLLDQGGPIQREGGGGGVGGEC
jgi:hypothetical protein